MDSQSKRIISASLGLIIGLVVGFGWIWINFSTPPTLEASTPLQSAWDFSQTVGTYHFTANAQQTLIPRAMPSTIGQTSVRVDMRIDGDVNLPNDTRLSMSVDGVGLDPTPVTLVQNGIQTYLMKNGEKTPLDSNPAALASPSGDYLSYLAAAENIQPCEIDGAPLPGTTACYTYHLNGEKYAKYVRDQIKAELEANPALLPPGATANPPLASELIRMSGQGKVWLDADNLPVRMTVNMDMPEFNPSFDAKIKLVLDYQFDGQAVADAKAAVEPQIVGFWHGSLPNMNGWLMFAMALIPVGLLGVYQRRKWMYNIVATGVIFSMVSVPLVHAATYTRFFERQARAADASQVFTDMVSPQVDDPAVPPDAMPAQPLSPREQMELTTQSFPDAYCGKGGNGDTDGDGLSDAAEYCLGTDPNSQDSDYDFVPDGMEVAGAQIPVLQNGTTITQTWYTDPTNPDSNGDGRNDNDEWAMEDGGASLNWDLDNDGVPNLWDMDDDGDGVPDNRDISPTSYTGLITDTTKIKREVIDPSHCNLFDSSGCASKPITTTIFNLTNSYDGYLYVDLQIQPKDKDHLRYGMTPLDWGRDDKGQIQQLNDSTDDIRLIPMLSVQTNVPPDIDLARQYNITVLHDTDNDGYSEMTIPLGVVGTNGASVEAFAAKIAYGPNELKNLGPKGVDWKDARLVWTVLGKLDREGQKGADGESSVTETNSPIHTYVETAFRITGLEVTKSGPFRAAILGTPNSPNDDRQLFQLLFGLSDTFLTHQQPDLDEIKTRFTGANTPIEQKWGVTTTVAIDLPATWEPNQEVGIVAINGRIDTFISDHYSNITNTVIIAAEASRGATNMDGLISLKSPTEISPTLAINLNDISLTKQRTLSINMRKGFRPLLSNELAVEVMNRNRTAVETAATDLKDQYPGISGNQLLALTVAMYATWESGVSRALAFDGNTNLPAAKPDADVYKKVLTEPRDRFGDPANIRTLPGYFIEVAHLGREGGGLSFLGGGVWQYLRANADEAGMVGFTFGTGKFLSTIDNTLLDVLGRGELAFDVHFTDKEWEKFIEQEIFTDGTAYNYSKTIVGNAANVVGQVKDMYGAGMTAKDTIVNVRKGFSTAYKSIKSVKSFKTVGKALKGFASKTLKAAGNTKAMMKEMTSKFGLAALAIDIAFSVVFFFAAGDFSGQAIAMLIAQIIFSVMMFLISTIPPWVGTVITIVLGLIDLFLMIFGSSFSISGWVTEQIAKYIYDEKPLTEIDDFKLLGRGMKLANPDMGYIKGNRLIITDTFKGSIKMHGTKGFFESLKPDTDDAVTMALTGGWGVAFVMAQKVDVTGKLQSLFGVGMSDPDELLRKSWICGEFSVAGWSDSNEKSDLCPLKYPNYNLSAIPKNADNWQYENPINISISLDKEGSNVKIPLQMEVTAQTVNDASIINPVGYGLLGRIHWEKTRITNLPGDMPKDDRTKKMPPEDVYIDVIPPTVEKLWTWEDTLFANHDPDGDGMTTEDEISAQLGSKAYDEIAKLLKPYLYDETDFGVERFLAHWDANESASSIITSAVCNAHTEWAGLCSNTDSPFWLKWDSDGDGLSDKFEFDHNGNLGTNLKKADTDGDGLNDGLEFSIGTSIKDKDSDADGVPDGVEAYHVSDGKLVGGWVISVTKVGSWSDKISVPVFSDPKLADTDGDGLNDGAEYKLGTGPKAFNRAPRVALNADPLDTSPTGVTAMYLKPGDNYTVTVNLDVFPPFTSSETLSLQFPGNVLIPENQTSGLNGSRSIPNNGNTVNPRWSFATQVMQPGYYEYTTSKGYAAYISASDVGTLTLSLPFWGDTLQDTQSVVVDAERPTFGMLKPRAGQLIGGGVTDYVIGGYSDDVTTWVDHIRMDVPGLGWQTVASRDAGDSLSPWAYTWNLPSDGVYTLQGFSTDFVGNDSYADSVDVMVDNTAPSVTVNLTDGTVYGPPQGSDVITITLNGTANDNYSGLTRVQISTDDGPWREVWQLEDATPTNTTYSTFNSTFANIPTGATWNAVWTLPNVDTVQGYHSIRVRAFDKAGNWPQYLERNIIVDVIPPTSELTDRGYLYNPPHIPTNVSRTFDGVANDVGNVPQPSRPADLAGNLNALDDATIWLGFNSITEDDGGVNVQWIGDFNGDRRKDLLVGLPAADGGNGRVSIVYGRSGDWPVPNARELLNRSRTSFVGVSGAGIGLNAMPAGDFNGDGRADLLIGDPVNNRVFLVYGQPVYMGKDVLLDGTNKQMWVVLTPPAGEQIGQEVAPVGDVNGDGFADVVIGGANNYAYLLSGQPLPAWEIMPLDSYNAARIGNAPGSKFYATGDLDGDFKDEFAISQNNQVALIRGSIGYGAQAQNYIDANSPLDTFSSADPFPQVAALGDVNGDHIDDMIYTDGTNQHVAFGDSNLGDGSWTTKDYTLGVGFVAAAGDVDVDGLNDILIGGDTTAYLILGNTGTLGGAQATIGGVSAAASAPLAINADLNSDASSDLLLIPTNPGVQVDNQLADSQKPDIPPMWVPHPNPPQLQTYAGSNNYPAYPGADAYVSSSGDCHGQSPCYTTIQAAVDAHSGGDLIIVQPGVYAPFTIDNKNNMAVQGMDADVVFVDAAGGSFAVKIMNATGVNLKNMTLRNANYGVQLDSAGLNGYLSTSLTNRTQLDHLLIYDVSVNDVYMSRTSTVTITRSTLVRTNNHIGVYGAADSSVPSGWIDKGSATWPIYDGGGATAMGDDVYIINGGGGGGFHWYDASTETWGPAPWGPNMPLEPGSAIAAGSDGQVYLMTGAGWDDVGGGLADSVGVLDYNPANGHVFAVPFSGDYLAEWDGSAWTKYTGLADANQWYLTVDYGTGHAFVYNNSDGIMEWNPQYSSWTNVVTDWVSSLESYGGILYAGTSPGSGQYEVSKMQVGVSDWQTIVPNLDGTVTALELDDRIGTLYVGGDFTDRVKQVDVNSGSTAYIGSPGSVITTGTVYDITYDEFTGDIYACGDINGSGIAKYDGSNWTKLPNIPGDTGSGICYSVAYKGDLYAVGRWYVTGQGWKYVARWNGSSWETYDADWYPNSAIATNQGIYIGGPLNQMGDTGSLITVQNVARIHTSNEVYSPTANAWSSLTLPAIPRQGASYAGDDSGNLYFIQGGGSSNAYKYNIASQTWIKQILPGSVNASAMTQGYGGSVRALVDGGDFYTNSGGGWNDSTSLYGLSPTTAVITHGISMAYDPKRNDYYVLPGGNGVKLFKLDGTTWSDTGQDTPGGVFYGAGLAYVPTLKNIGGSALFALRGNGTADFWQYPLPEPNKVGFDHSIIFAPTAGGGDWLNLTDPLPVDFNFRMGAGNYQYNGTHLPNNGGSLPAASGDPFLDSTRKVYRLPNAGLDMGYHAYVVPLTATTTTGIQSVLNSGTNQVVVEPGIYQESLYLPNGVNVIGGNPEWTIIRPLNGSSDPLVRIDGAAGASLSHIMLDAQGNGRDGLYVGGRAQNATFERSIVSGATNGVLVNGSGTDVAIANATIARNVNGLNATNCASVDVRNSIFAYHTGAGLSYQNCAATKLHTYNLFWQNGSDFGVDATAGAGELFLDPIFVDPTNNDYRTVNYSPVIDTGNPTDPAPPGSGNRADIGYVEQGRANFYVDAAYCPLCVNDGLTWGVDAFNKIQDALDEAAAVLGYVQSGAEYFPQLTVGVAPGTYNENVSVPSHVMLLGSGAEVTTIDAGGSGSAVTFDGVTDATVVGFSLTGGTGVNITGASNNVVVFRNIIRGNTVGVALSNRATGQLNFNTIVNNTVGVSANGAGVWMAMDSNIVSGNGTGLSAASNGQIYSDYNLLFNTADVNGVTVGTDDVTGQNPQFGGGAPYRLTAVSPALDMAAPDAVVPEGGGTRADAGYSELLAPPISLMLGKEDLSSVMGNSGVASVEYSVVSVADNTQPITATLPSGGWQSVTLASPGDTVSYWQTSYTPTAEGVYRFYSRATDMVGNQETDEKAWFEGSFIADSTPPTVQWLSPADGNSTVSPIELRAQVSDYAAERWSVDENDVHFVVDGVTYPATWAVEPWQPDGSPRVFRAWITPTVGTHSNVVAYAADQAGNSASDNSVSFTITGPGPIDIAAPSLTILNPIYGGWVTHTVTFSGTVSDGESGVASVEVSVDGGVTFRPATISGTVWSVDWTGTPNQAFVSFPMVVRAEDRAGNTTTTPWLFTIDEIPPGGLAPVTFNAPEGSHFDTAQSLVINWNSAIDGSGVITTLLAVDQITDTVPSTAVAGTGAVRSLNDSGEWYVHLGAMDAAGNMTLMHFGPWYVGIDDGVAFSQQQQSIQIDGVIDTLGGEWRLDKEFLDNDERTVGSNVTYSPNTPQAFYTAWDANSLYLAWHGGYWSMDGTLWVYLNTGTGGNSQFITPIASAPTALLPFAANYAVEITSPLTGTLWEYNGSAWQASADPWEFEQGPDGDTEIKLSLYGTSNVETLAFGQGDDGNVWAVFPATNPLNPAGVPLFTLNTLNRGVGMAAPLMQTGGWQAYSYPDITTAVSPAANQPKAVSAEISMDTPQSTGTAWGPGNTLQYVVKLSNLENYTLTNQSLSFLAVPSGSLIHDSISGATCVTTNPWICTVSEVPPGMATITLTTHLVSNLTGITDTTMYIDLQNNSIPPEMVTQGKIIHQMDNQPPEVTVESTPFVYLGTQSIQGTSFDAGIGVDYVEIQPDGGSWQRAVGTDFWTGDVTVSPFAQNGDIVRVFVRAADKFGQMSASQEVTFTVDLQAPAVSLTTPAAMNGTFVDIAGLASDQPSGNESTSVFVEVDNDPWREATLFATDISGNVPFRWIWNMPTEDGITHTIRVRATDSVDNDGYLNPVQYIMVDNVAPVLTATQVFTEVVVQNYRPGVLWGLPVLTGTVTDGGGGQAVTVQIEEPNGNIYDAPATVISDTWTFTPTLTLTGTHYLRPRAVDGLGNTTYGDTFNLHVIAAPDAANNTFITPEDTPLMLTPLFNDIDLDSTILMISAVTTPTVGTVAISGTQQLMYTPTLNFNGIDVFTYTVSDEMALVGSATITISVTPVNDAPIITGSHTISVTMSEDSTPTPFSKTLQALDVDNDVLTWTISSAAIHGNAAISDTISISAPTASIAYTPTLNFTGVDTFTVQVTDGALTDTTSLTVTVEPVNDAPAPVTDTLVVLRHNGSIDILATSSSISILNVLSNDFDAENDPLSVTAIGIPSNGGTVNIDTLGNLTAYTPTSTFSGTESFTYTVSDGLLSANAVVVATVINGQGGGSVGESFTAVSPAVSGTVTTSVAIPSDVPTNGAPLALIFNTGIFDGNAPDRLSFAGFAFTLDAYVDGQVTSPFTFTIPVTVTIEYDNSPVAQSLAEAMLDVRYRDGNQWLNDGITIIERDTINDRIVFTISHLTQFALFEPHHTIYLPLVMK